MIALCIGLAALSTALTGFVILQGVWLHSAGRDAVSYADHLDGQRQLVAEYKHKYETEFAAHGVTTRQLDDERALRSVAEAQRNEAQRRVADLLRQHIKDASNEEIQQITLDAFRSPLSVVPASVPAAASSDRLLRPGEDL